MVLVVSNIIAPPTLFPIYIYTSMHTHLVSLTITQLTFVFARALEQVSS